MRTVPHVEVFLICLWEGDFHILLLCHPDWSSWQFLLSAIWETFTLFSIMAARICTPTNSVLGFLFLHILAAAKSLQSCLTLCDPLDCSPPGSAVPGILQARTLEWAAISFSNAWKWKVKVKSLSRVWLFTTPWTAAHQAPLPMGFSRQEYWSGLPLPSPTSLLTFVICGLFDDGHSDRCEMISWFWLAFLQLVMLNTFSCVYWPCMPYFKKISILHVSPFFFFW